MVIPVEVQVLTSTSSSSLRRSPEPSLFFDFRNQDVTGDFYNFNRDTYESEYAEANAARGKIGNGGYTREQVNGGEVGRYTTSASGEKLYHKVKAGETLTSIAEKRGVSVEQILPPQWLSQG